MKERTTHNVPKVLFPTIRNLNVLPPVINLINCLAAGLAKVTVISYDLNKDSFEKEVETISISKIKYPVQLFLRIKAKVKAHLYMYYYLSKNAKQFDYIWIGAWDYKFLDRVSRFFGFKGKIIYHFHELEFEKLKYCRKADFCVVPEENRLWITYFLAKLQKKPLLLPNIPYLPFVQIEKIPSEFISLKEEGKEIILYQGLINFEKRCLNELLEAIKILPLSMVLVIMPMPSTSEKLLQLLKERVSKLNICSKVLIIKPQLPPHHLNYIKYADLGIGLYRPTTLNQIYAAPNRLFEFTKFSVPIILPDFPAFKSLSSIFKFGITAIDPESPEEIARSISVILNENNLNKGREQAARFFKENGDYKNKVKQVWSEIIK